MSQQKQIIKVMDLLLAEDQEQASALLHQVIVNMSRNLYESIVDEESEGEDLEEAKDDDTDVGGDPESDFTNDIKADTDDIDADEHNDGEASDDDDEGFDADFNFDDETDAGTGGKGEIEDRVGDLESQLEELRAEFDELMGEELQEPEHADLADEYGDEFDGESDEDGGFGDQEFNDNTDGTEMFEKKKPSKLEKAPLAKDKRKEKKVDEETQFLTKVADTGQKGTAKLVGTGKSSNLGAENTKSPYTNIPARKDYGGKPVKIGSGTGGEYGKYNAKAAEKMSTADNTKVEPKKNSVKADTTPKFTGGKTAGDAGNKSPLSKKPAR